MKRFISTALAILLCVGLALPGAAAQTGSAPQSAWAAIERIEKTVEAGVEVQDLGQRTAAYEDAVGQMIRAVCAAPDYVPGSMDRHGDFFFWETKDGRANGYSPSLRARISLAAASSGDDLSGTFKNFSCDQSGLPAAQTGTRERPGTPPERSTFICSRTSRWTPWPRPSRKTASSSSTPTA